MTHDNSTPDELTPSFSTPDSWSNHGYISFFAISVGLVGAFVAMTFIGDAVFRLPVLREIFSFRYYPLLLVAVPILSGPLQAILGKKRVWLRNLTAVGTTFLAFLFILAMYPQLLSDSIYNTVPGVFGYGLHFHVDWLSYVMAAVSGVMWLLVSIYAREYMAPEQHQDRFYLWMSVTLGGVLGTVMASDILTMFLFFELMTFSSYMLVAHNESTESILAGNNYIYMGVAGGLAVLVAVILILFSTRTLEFTYLAAELAETGWIQYAVAGLLMLGFGVKAGMLPVHIWLPKAHPVAPTPASALLSGVLVKVGTYGILRVNTSFFMPVAGPLMSRDNPLWNLSHISGAVVIWIGILTMAVGVFMALQQSNMKKMLAYHSISQMGYIIMGAGVAAYLGYYGAMGFSGAVYHTINHALFKGLLFMVAGVVYLRYHDINMYNLGGLWKKLPITFVVCVIAVLGITGMPLFNGFASKSILHHAIDEAYKYGHSSFRYAEVIFTIVSAGTVCSFIKLISYTFLGPCPEKIASVPNTGNKMMQMAMSGLAVLIIAIGIFPNYLMNMFIIPAVRGFTYDPKFIDSYIVNMNFFNSHDLMGTVQVYALGFAIFFVGKKFHLFHLHLPKWLSVEYVMYKPMQSAVLRFSRHVTANYESKATNADVYIYAAILMGSLLMLTIFF
ncbi:MAG: complex I subunit 5 family protein [Spirochaetia bacterium]